jgi:hypothetical protein
MRALLKSRTAVGFEPAASLRRAGSRSVYQLGVPYTRKGRAAPDRFAASDPNKVLQIVFLTLDFLTVWKAHILLRHERRFAQARVIARQHIDHSARKDVGVLDGAVLRGACGPKRPGR